jgi:hypothetical protein
MAVFLGFIQACRHPKAEAAYFCDKMVRYYPFGTDAIEHSANRTVLKGKTGDDNWEETRIFIVYIMRSYWLVT